MTSEFRDLERPQALRKKDVVLMATVTSFESLTHPSKSELRQFAELFTPLFNASSPEARREAVAALSQSAHVPSAVAFFIGCQPIAIAAPFLTASTCLSDDALIAIARTQGEAHARAIVRRDALSPTVIDALVGMRQQRNAASKATPAAPVEDAAPPVPPAPQAPAADAHRIQREEELRRRIKLLADHVSRPSGDRLGLRSLTPVQEALLVRFARNREAGLLATLLADVLTTSRWLAERIMLDLSGQQLATVLKSLDLGSADATFVLTRLYGHLAQAVDGVSRAEHLWLSLDADQCARRVEAWRKSEGSAQGDEQQQPEAGQAGQQAEDRPLRTSATIRKTVSGFRIR